MAKKKVKLNTNNKKWETVIDFTKISKDGISARDLLKKLKEIDG